jgi:hypothetical protein
MTPTTAPTRPAPTREPDAVPRCREKHCRIPLVTPRARALGVCWFCEAASPAPVRRRPNGRRAWP